MNIKQIYASILIIFWLFFLSYTQATDNWWSYGNTPIEIIDNIAWEANAYRHEQVQNTRLNDIDRSMWAYDWDKRIANTMDVFRDKLSFYINIIVWIWLSIAVILIIYNWFILIAKSWSEWEIKKVQTRLIYLSIWVLVLVWFPFLIKIVLSLIESIA